MSQKSYQGLTPQEIENSRQQFGVNLLTPAKRLPWWKQLLGKFDDPIIKILLVATILSFIIGAVEGDFIESIGILIAIFLATTIAFFNEYKAGKEFDILNQVNDSTPVTVIREGQIQQIPKQDLVVGDIIRVETGEEVPADCEIIDLVSLQVNESSLTGEAAPVTKSLDPNFHKDTATYPANLLLRSTFITDGYAFAKVSAVGDHSEIGKTARAAMEDNQNVTPLTRQLDKLSHAIGIVGMTVAISLFTILFAFALFQKKFTLTNQHWIFLALLILSMAIAGWSYLFSFFANHSISPKVRRFSLGLGFILFIGGTFILGHYGIIASTPKGWLPLSFIQTVLSLFMISVTIIVVAVPEGLPMSVTLSLAYSMRRMTATNNLVRKLSACETIGATTVICSDKTGTLTMNEMRVHKAIFPSHLADLIDRSIAINTTANLGKNDLQESIPLGNPTEGALLLWLEQQNKDYRQLRTQAQIIKQWSFTTERKFMATIAQNDQETPVLYLKGAPEIILARTSQYMTEQGPAEIATHLNEIQKELKSYQAIGMRTIALATGDYTQEDLEKDPDLWAKDLTWLGFVAINDPVRPAVPKAILQCQQSGIAVKVVTGDTQETATEIARQIHLWQENDTSAQHITGKDFAKLSDEEAKIVASQIKVMSRARPMDKKRLIDLLKTDTRNVVAVTGDGVNDGPALKAADVGLAMGKTGTAVAREAGDIILLDDSFTSIVNAIKWGRSLYENIQRFILFQLTINITALCIAVLGPFFGVNLPLTVTQMLWINLIMDTLAALALATEPPHENVMARQPRNVNRFIITPTMAKNIAFTATIFVVTLIALLKCYVSSQGSDLHDHHLTVFFSIFVFLQFWNLFNMRSLGSNDSAFTDISKNHWFILIAGIILVGQIALVQFGGSVFRTTPLGLQEWLMIILGTSVILWLGEIIRAVKRILDKKHNSC